jgi:type II secretory pathway component PulC
MRQPFWIINSILLVLVLLVLLFVYFSQVSIPERENIEPSVSIARKKEKRLQVNIRQIYEADLFGSYQMAIEQADLAKQPIFPQPPEPQPTEIPELPTPQFLDPLDVALKGIFLINNDGTKNRVIISDNKTKQEATHKIGDKIGDAQLIRIFSNKIMLLRSNGQQEVVYLREQDAKFDAGYSMIDEWSLVVKQMSSGSFLIDPIAFAKRVQDLGQLIEMLHLITAYKQGVSMGCRIGKLDEKSIGTALGLQPGDIITTIDGIQADNMTNRLQIYQSVLGKKENELIVVQLLRNKEELVFEYQLRNLVPEEGQKETPHNKFLLQKIEGEEKRKILQQKYEFAPTIQDIRNRERLNMLQKGGMPQP